ncbi:hypothetical protein BDK88_4013 [Natrinema hispanicum]|uniref:Uncharacterized protein n=1 Tax=Natrinema hispanicum TaxID=392421 RepID=A0A482YB33_9EURY|nr:hypothetical protein [Natrinema hispanicum]RZV06058.1 hypothetical protein BDK88_4013 [Natrinema hispanicum]
MATIRAGLAGGVIATIGMTLLMIVMGDDGPPPTAQFVSTFADGDPDDYAMLGLMLHILYSIGAGVVFVVGVPLLGLEFGSIGSSVALGLVYGIVLMIGGMAFWMRTVLGIEPDRGMMTMFGTVHIVYGVVLGAIVGAGIIA